MSDMIAVLSAVETELDQARAEIERLREALDHATTSLKIISGCWTDSLDARTMYRGCTLEAQSGLDKSRAALEAAKKEGK